MVLTFYVIPKFDLLACVEWLVWAKSALSSEAFPDLPLLGEGQHKFQTWVDPVRETGKSVGLREGQLLLFQTRVGSRSRSVTQYEKETPPRILNQRLSCFCSLEWLATNHPKSWTRTIHSKSI